MSTGACIIDGTDIVSFGAFIARGGDHELISFPARKEPDMNDWPEEDGVEPELDNPVFEPKKLTVKYYCKGDEKSLKSHVAALIDLHYQPGYRSVYIREFDKTFQLRFAGVSDYRQTHGFVVSGEKGAFVDIDYWMDDPLQFIDPLLVVPANGRNATTHVRLNSIDLANYGIIVKDIYTSAMKISLKQGLIIDSRYRSGQTADADYLQKDVAEVSIDCAMVAATRADFWNNYNALFNNLTGSFRLGLTAAHKDVTCWYKGMTDFSKRPWSDRVFCEFRLTIVAYGWNEMIYLLATEAGHLIVTEDNVVIDITI